MRRTIGEKSAVTRAGTRFRLAALAFVLTMMAPPGASGEPGFIRRIYLAWSQACAAMSNHSAPNTIVTTGSSDRAAR